jgi:hypothetical protein
LLARGPARFDLSANRLGALSLAFAFLACGGAQPPYASTSDDRDAGYWQPDPAAVAAYNAQLEAGIDPAQLTDPSIDPNAGAAPPEASASAEDGATTEQDQALKRVTKKPIVGPPRTQKPSLGVNIGQVDYFSKQIMFLDLMKQAADWGLNSGGALPKVDKNGWVKALASGHRAGFVANSGKGGRYVILYDGKGQISVGNGQPLSQSPGRDLVQLNGGETHFTIERSDPGNPIRNIRIVPVENEFDHEAELFHPKFLELVKPFSVLRFMDYAKTNNSKQEHWSDRPTPEYFSQGTERGAAIEYAIALCNRVQSDCWFNIPHMADDDYIHRYAELVRDKLDPKLKAYVEYSNEVWNFEHGEWIQRAGERAGMKKEWDTRLRYQARRSLQIFKIFEKALGLPRLVRVLAGQCWDLRLTILLDAEKAYQHADAMAIAPYFGFEISEDANIPRLRGKSAPQVAEAIYNGLDAQHALLKQLKKIADDRGLRTIGYEGGQHLATGGQFHEDTTVQTLLDEVNRSPRMGDAYGKYLDLWRDEGGQIMVLYKLVDEYSKWGRWGLLEEMWQPVGSAPKYIASISFMQRQKRWWDDDKPMPKPKLAEPAPASVEAHGSAREQNAEAKPAGAAARPAKKASAE